MVSESRERGALRPNEAAQWLGVSRDTLERLFRKGEVKSFKIGASRFVSTEELQRFIRNREEEANC